MQGTAPAPNWIAALWELNRRLGAKLFFSSFLPDWLSVSRYYETLRASDVSCAKELGRPEKVMAAGEKHQRGKMALHVLHSLQLQHEKFFYREIRKLCMDFVISLGLPLTDRSSAAGESLSEVMAKLLGAGSSNNIDDAEAIWTAELRHRHRWIKGSVRHWKLSTVEVGNMRNLL